MKIIDADKLHYKQVYIQTEKGLRPALVVFAKEIRKMPAIPQIKVQVDPVKPGRWRYDKPLGLEWCSKCGFGKRNGDKRWYSYCPSCGAKMEVENVQESD